MKRGDHLYYYRAGSVYSHHGISCGDGSVVHYESSVWQKVTGSLRSDGAPRVCRVALDEFAQGHDVQVRWYAQSDPAELVLTRALSRLGEADYDLMANNCEHFAVWCKTGHAKSTQVEAHHAARRALVQGSPLGLSLLRATRRVPRPYRGVAVAGALAVAGSVYAGTYLSHRLRAKRAGWS